MTSGSLLALLLLLCLTVAVITILTGGRDVLNGGLAANDDEEE